jgi:transposase InsO family protein
MCRLLSLSRSAYYRWVKKPRSTREIRNDLLKQRIRALYGEGRGEYGTPTIYNMLREQDVMVNRKRVVRLMRQMGLFSKVVKKFKRTTRGCTNHQASPNLLKQNFQTDGPNRVWLSDITFLWTFEGWLYLTMIKDLWSRRVLGYTITGHMRAEAVLHALQMALSHRNVQPGLIFHSDRGKQYVDHRVRKVLAERGIVQSMSSTGNCYDNAPAESFFATMKKGHLFWGGPFRTKEQARRRITEYLDVFYNCVRRHSSLGYKSPVAFELHNTILA